MTKMLFVVSFFSEPSLSCVEILLPLDSCVMNPEWTSMCSLYIYIEPRKIRP